MSTDPRFVWLDLEMTGLDLNTCAIIEIGILITGRDLKPIAQYETAIWQPDEVLARMDPFVRDMHTKNGLLEQVRASKTSLRDAEREAMKLVTAHTRYKEGVLAGNSIHTDRRFLIEYMPQLEGYLHYRQLDVSSLKVLTRAWYPGKNEFFKEGKSHSAISDLRDSIEELEHYKKHFFV